MTIKAIYEKGVFRPIEPVSIPEKSEVELSARVLETPVPGNDGKQNSAQEAIFEILSRSYVTGQTDTAARHNEHQP